jgi:class 3 adenylate cyclase
MKVSVGVKIFSVVVILLVLVGSAAWINARKAESVQSIIVDMRDTYVPAYGSLARASLYSVDEGLFARRMVIAKLLSPDDKDGYAKLKQLTAEKSQQADAEFAAAQRLIDQEIADPASLENKIELSRLDARLEFLQARHRDYDAVLLALENVLDKGDAAEQKRRIDELDRQRDELNVEADRARLEMRGLLDEATKMAANKQTEAVYTSLILLALALALGAVASAFITMNLVGSLRRLLRGTALVQQGALDTEVPVTSRDEVGELTAGFNSMVKELRAKARIRETFGRYVDPRIVEGLIDQPDRLAGTGDRREMTVLFCDMRGFTSLSEGMTPAGMVRIVNRYLALMSEPVRRNHGIIDKYIGDAIMAFWGPPFSPAEEHSRLACAAGLEQLAALHEFRAELPDLTGFRRGIPHIDMRIGVATGEVIVGNIGSDVSMSYTVMGDAVNFASRLEGANKAYGTRFLVNVRTAEMAGDVLVFREVDQLLVEGKQEPQHVYEVLGRRGELPLPVVAMAERFAEGLADYRGRNWKAAATAFKAALEAVPEDGPSRVFLHRVARLEAEPPPPDWKGVWTLSEK